MLRRLSTGLILCAALAGCGGGGSSGPAQLPQAPASSAPIAPAPGPQNVAVSIVIPAAPATGSSIIRRPRYVSANTSSAAVTVNGGARVVANLAPGSAACVPAAGGGRTCTINVSAPAQANDSFAVSLYASTDATGAVLSQNTVAQTITAGKQNVVNITLHGIVASIKLSLANANPPAGSVTTTALTVNFLDASGATIIGADPFVTPVTMTLTDSDGSGTTTLSKTSLTAASPDDVAGITVTYNGNPLAQAIFGVTASGFTAANITTATLVPQTTATPAALVDWPTYGYDSQRSGYNPYTTGITPASIAQMHVAWQTAVNGATQTQPIIVTNVAGHAALLVIANFAIAQAYDALTGKRVWQTTLPTQDVQDCGLGGISGTAQYDKSLNAIFMAAGSANSGSPNHVVLYKLDAGTGSISGQVDVTPTLQAGEANYSHTGITLANGRIYLGTGSDCEGTATGKFPSWRGRVVSVDPAAMTLLSTFYTTWAQGGNYGGGGVWSWGGVSSDPSGNIYVAAGNAETSGSAAPQIITAPFVAAPNEQVGYGEHLVQLSGDLSNVANTDLPAFNFTIGHGDLDYSGTPVVYQPPVGSGCGVLTATQSKGGTLIVNNTQGLSELGSFKLSVPSSSAYYVGNPAYSPKTGYLYAPITSSGAGSSLLPPGLAAIGGCGTSIAWNAQFGPDSTFYQGENPRSAPTVTAGGVVFQGTPCTPDGKGGCGPAGAVQGALWAVDGTTGSLLGGGKPLVITGDNIRMAPSADGLWVFVLDGSGNFYGLTVDPSVTAITPTAARRITNRLKARGSN